MHQAMTQETGLYNQDLKIWIWDQTERAMQRKPSLRILTDLPASRAVSEILSPSLSASPPARTGATSVRDTGRGAAATTGLVVAALKVADLVAYSMLTGL